jgi:hypothetical protein
VELTSGFSDNGPAWIGYVTPSKQGRPAYFNDGALLKLKGQRRDADGGNYVDKETRESYGYPASRRMARTVIGLVPAKF